MKWGNVKPILLCLYFYSSIIKWLLGFTLLSIKIFPRLYKLYEEQNKLTKTEDHVLHGQRNKKFGLQLKGAARTQAPTATNYDVGCSTWEHLRQAPLLSAMEVTDLGHGPSWLSIDPIQVSMLPNIIHFQFITTSPRSFA